MTIREFNEALDQLRPAISKLHGTDDPEDWANLIIRAAIHGLVIMPCDMELPEIPQPICKLVKLPKHHAEDSGIYYLIPADQVHDDRK